MWRSEGSADGAAEAAAHRLKPQLIPFGAFSQAGRSDPDAIVAQAARAK